MARDHSGFSRARSSGERLCSLLRAVALASGVCVATGSATNTPVSTAFALCGTHATVKGGWCVCEAGTYAFNMSQHTQAIELCGPRERDGQKIRKQPNHHMNMAGHCLCLPPDKRLLIPSYRCGEAGRPNTVIVDGSCECIPGAVTKDRYGGACERTFSRAVDAEPTDDSNNCGCFMKSWAAAVEVKESPRVGQNGQSWGDQTGLMEKRRRDTRSALERMASVRCARPVFSFFFLNSESDE